MHQRIALDKDVFNELVGAAANRVVGGHDFVVEALNEKNRSPIPVVRIDKRGDILPRREKKGALNYKITGVTRKEAR